MTVRKPNEQRRCIVCGVVISIFRPKKGQLEHGGVRMLIDKFLPAGITYIGGNPGSGKTWLALSLSKALVTGEPFLGVFSVLEPSNVLYLAVEVGDRALNSRLEKMGIPDDNRFMCRTVQDGTTKLDDPRLTQFIALQKPVVILDTAIRFIKGSDENAAGQVAMVLGDAALELMKAGAPAVVAVHHATKASKDKTPTLETTLRGSGDIGASADAVYSLNATKPDTLTVEVPSVKGRDIEMLSPFTIIGRPHIDAHGDFGMLVQPSVNESEVLMALIRGNPEATYTELRKGMNVDTAKVQRLAKKLGLRKERGGPWTLNGEAIQRELLMCILLISLFISVPSYRFLHITWLRSDTFSLKSFGFKKFLRITFHIGRQKGIHIISTTTKSGGK